MEADLVSARARCGTPPTHSAGCAHETCRGLQGGVLHFRFGCYPHLRPPGVNSSQNELGNLARGGRPAHGGVTGRTNGPLQLVHQPLAVGRCEVAQIEVMKALSGVFPLLFLMSARVLAGLASPENWPDHLDPAVADGVQLFVQVHRGIGVADHELNLVSDVPSGTRRLELDPSHARPTAPPTPPSRSAQVAAPPRPTAAHDLDLQHGRSARVGGPVRAQPPRRCGAPSRRLASLPGRVGPPRP